jgi:hypothetical protein
MISPDAQNAVLAGMAVGAVLCLVAEVVILLVVDFLKRRDTMRRGG